MTDISVIRVLNGLKGSYAINDKTPAKKTEIQETVST